MYIAHGNAASGALQKKHGGRRRERDSLPGARSNTKSGDLKEIPPTTYRNFHGIGKRTLQCIMVNRTFELCGYCSRPLLGSLVMHDEATRHCTKARVKLSLKVRLHYRGLNKLISLEILQLIRQFRLLYTPSPKKSGKSTNTV